jgi:transcription elongation factor SPT5
VTSNGPDLSKMNPALQMKNGMNGNGAMAPPKSFGRDRTLGKTVTIRKGPYKGMLGIVKDATDTTARVELHSKSKVVNIDKDSLAIKEYALPLLTPSDIGICTNISSSPITGQTMDLRGFGGGARTPSSAARTGFGSATPSRTPTDWSGGRTPMAGADGGRTPAWGAAARTPAWSGSGGSGIDSSRTPAWKPQSGSQTAYGGAGNTTSYGGTTYGAGAGAKTPAWQSGARTPYGQDHGGSGFDAFAAGSRTPAYGSAAASGSRTPAWGGAAASAPTPGQTYDAPTPGRTHEDFPTPYGGAPTPAASAPTPRYGDEATTPAAAKGANREPLRNNRFDAPTPRYDAPTPAASAPTPAPYGSGYDAPTPAAGTGTGDGPRYTDDSDEE